MTEQSESESQQAGVVEQSAAPAPTPTSGGRGLVLLCLLLAIAAAGFSVWQWWQGQQEQQRSGQIVQRLDALAGDVGSVQALQRQGTARVQQALDDLTSLREQQERVEQQLRDREQAEGSRQQQWRNGLARVDAIERIQQRQAEELLQLSGADRDAWQLEELGHLLRMAEQRLLLAGDLRTAERLLGAADNIARDMDDAAVYPLRAAVAEDLAVLRALPAQDISGLFLRLDALHSRIEQLPIKGLQRTLPEQPETSDEVPADTQWDWRAAWQRIWSRLREFIVVRRREEPVEPLLPPQQEYYLRQHLHLGLQQAQIALLQSQTKVFQQALRRMEDWLPQWFETGHPAVIAMQAELTVLAATGSDADLPTLGASLAALRAYRSTRDLRGAAD